MTFEDDEGNTNVSHTAMYSNIEILPSPLKSAFSKISQRAEIGTSGQKYCKIVKYLNIAFCVS